MAGNTEILIKRSLSTGVPGSLQQGELAYSYASNTIFIGTPDGLGTVNVGGQFYTSQIDTATDAATGDKLVRRDGSGNATFNQIYGSLGTTIDTLSAGVYGDQTNIPVITVAANGIVTNVSTTTISTDLSIAGDSGTDSISLLNDTLTFAGGEGITSSVDSGTNTITFDVDTTVVRSNTAGANQTIDGDVNISGNLIVLGTQTTVNSTTVTINDPLLLLANNNTQDVLDIGTIGQYSPDGGSTILRTGVYRHAGDQQYYVFDGYSGDISANTVNPGDTSFHLATLNANLTAPTANLTQASITTANVSGDIGVVGSAFVGTDLVVTGTTTLTGQANTTNDLGVGGSAYVTDSATVGQQLFVNNLTNANTNYVVYYDTSTKELKYDSLDTLAPDNLANGSSYFAVSSDGYAYSSGKILAAQSSSGTTGGGFSFTGTEGGADSGMFSSTDGVLDFYADNNQIAQITPSSFQLYTDLTLAGGSVLGNDSLGALYFGSNITGTAAGSIILNNSGNNLSVATEGFFVDPVRYTETQDATYDGLVFYNASTKEVRYSYALDGGSF